MMDQTAWDLIKETLHWLVWPLIAGMTFFIKEFFGRVKILEADVGMLKTKTSVTDAVLNEVKDDIKDIKDGVNRLIERK